MFKSAEELRPAIMSLLLRGGLVVTQDAERRIFKGDVLIEDGRIAAVGKIDEGGDEVIDCTGCAVIPGLINTHNHVANTLMRGLADDLPLEKMLEKTFAIDAHMTRRDVQSGALLGCVEMLKNGITSFVDLFYWEDEVARAARESGIRAFLAWVILDQEYTTQKGSPLKNAETFIRKVKGEDRVTPMAGVQGVYVCSEETYLATKDMSEREGVAMHTHLSETREEVHNHQRKHGLRPVEWLDKIGFLSNKLLAAHCVWVTLNEIRTLSSRGVKVSHCPVSNMKLASGGYAPVPEMLDEKVAVSLGTDSPVSNNGLDLFSDMKVCSLMHKASRWDASVMPAQKIFDLCTVDAARCLGRDDLGSVEVGKTADLAVVDFREPHTTPFYLENVLSQLVYSVRGSDVKVTIVGGDVLVRNGKVTSVNENDAVARAQTATIELLEGS